LRGWRKKGRECKHSIEAVRTGDTVVDVMRWKSIWMIHGNGVQSNAAVLIVAGRMCAEERGVAVVGEVEVVVAAAEEVGVVCVGLCCGKMCTHTCTEQRGGSGRKSREAAVVGEVKVVVAAAKEVGGGGRRGGLWCAAGYVAVTCTLVRGGESR
jgi:hypothetical protein